MGCFLIGTSWNDSVAANQFKALGHTLVERGHRVLFVVDGQRRDIENHEANPAIYTWPSPRPVNRQDASFFWQLLRTQRPTGVIAQFGSVNLVVMLSRVAGVPVRVAWYRTMSEQIELDVNVPSWKSSVLRNRKRLVYLMTTCVVCNSEATAADLRRTYAIDEEHCAVFPNLMADPAAQVQMGAGKKRPDSLVCVGRLDNSKGQDVLIRAMPELAARFPQVELELVGDGPAREHYERLAQELGVGDRCHFTGRLSHDEVLERMSAASVVVVPSRQEAFGNVNIEALSVGTPVVASNVGGIGEIIRDGIDGYLVPAADVGALAHAIAGLLSDEQLAARMSENARERFLDKFELSRNIPKLADWYLGLANAQHLSVN